MLASRLTTEGTRTLATRALWHVGFTVSDIERSIEFYTDGLGLALRHRQIQDNAYTRALVGYPDARLNVAQFSTDGSPPHSGHIIELAEYERGGQGQVPIGSCAVGAGHIALEVDDIDSMLDRITLLGGSLVGDVQNITAGINTGGRAIYLRDPDGITIELVEPPRGVGDLIQ